MSFNRKQHCNREKRSRFCHDQDQDLIPSCVQEPCRRVLHCSYIKSTLLHSWNLCLFHDQVLYSPCSQFKKKILLLFVFFLFLLIKTLHNQIETQLLIDCCQSVSFNRIYSQTLRINILDWSHRLQDVASCTHGAHLRFTLAQIRVSSSRNSFRSLDLRT